MSINLVLKSLNNMYNIFFNIRMNLKIYLIPPKSAFCLKIYHIPPKKIVVSKILFNRPKVLPTDFKNLPYASKKYFIPSKSIK